MLTTETAFVGVAGMSDTVNSKKFQDELLRLCSFLKKKHHLHNKAITFTDDCALAMCCVT